MVSWLVVVAQTCLARHEEEAVVLKRQVAAELQAHGVRAGYLMVVVVHAGLGSSSTYV